MDIDKKIGPNPEGFEKDPIGYGALAWYKWGMAQTVAGFHVDISKPPSELDLKSPILWMTQAQALSEAAISVFRREPNLEHIPILVRGVCHCQYHAVGLMLVGLSLEIALKSMLIVKNGVEVFIEKERSLRHHRLNELSEFIPTLTDKDRAILECLTHFIYWAGKYPDPGSGRLNDSVRIFEISESYEITAKQLSELATKIMKIAGNIIDEHSK